MVEEVDHPELGRIKQLSNPLRMDSFEGRTVRTPPPGLANIAAKCWPNSATRRRKSAA
jgi:hypothetical protein